MNVCGSEPAREGFGTFNIRVPDKPLSRAGSLPQFWIVYISQIGVGCQTAFAGKPAPTGTGWIWQRWVGSGDAFASRLAPTILDRVHQRDMSRLSGRLRWQASSHSLNRVHQRETGRLSGRLREQARSHKSKSKSKSKGKGKAAQLPAAQPPHSTMSASSSALDLAFDPPATSEG